MTQDQKYQYLLEIKNYIEETNHLECFKFNYHNIDGIIMSYDYGSDESIAISNISLTGYSPNWDSSFTDNVIFDLLMNEHNTDIFWDICDHFIPKATFPKLDHSFLDEVDWTVTHVYINKERFLEYIMLKTRKQKIANILTDLDNG